MVVGLKRFQSPRPFFGTFFQISVSIDVTFPRTAGTGIGRKNMTSFQAFVALVFICLIMDILLLTTTLPTY